MKARLRLVLLDANVVITLHELGLWDRVVENCDVHLSRVVSEEAHFYEDEHGERVDFDLQSYIRDGKVSVFEVSLSEIQAFRQQFGADYLERLHDGEAELLAHLQCCSQDCWICSGDSIVYRVLGHLGLGEAGISLEELLEKVGLGQRTLPPQFRRTFREHWASRGFDEGLRGIGGRRGR